MAQRTNLQPYKSFLLQEKFELIESTSQTENTHWKLLLHRSPLAFPLPHIILPHPFLLPLSSPFHPPPSLPFPYLPLTLLLNYQLPIPLCLPIFLSFSTFSFSTSSLLPALTSLYSSFSSFRPHSLHLSSHPPPPPPPPNGVDIFFVIETFWWCNWWFLHTLSLCHLWRALLLKKKSIKKSEERCILLLPNKFSILDRKDSHLSYYYKLIDSLSVKV